MKLDTGPEGLASPPEASAALWNSAIKRAWDGDARGLLELLLYSTRYDDQGKHPIPGTMFALPQDLEVRMAVVWVLLKGPLGAADNLDDLMTKTGWGKGKPRLSDLEVDVAGAYLAAGATDDELEGLAKAHDVSAEYLRKRIDQRRLAHRAKHVKALPAGGTS